jgi:hypothetical protein
MSSTLKSGDRVRISFRNRVGGYSCGDKGTVRKGPRKSPLRGVVYYVVSMDKNAHAWNVVFKADEIEPDV